MAAKRDKDQIKELIKKIGIQRFLASSGDAVNDMAVEQERNGDASFVLTERVAHMLWKASEL